MDKGSTQPPASSKARLRDRRGKAATLTAILGLAALLLAACSGSSRSAGSDPASSGGNSSPAGGSASSGNGGLTVAFSQCMRDHGITNFPDPNGSGSISGSGNASGNPINPMSPQFQAAQQACQKYLQGGSTGSPASQAQEINQALKVTACMRSHGYPGFPDPTISNGNIAFNGTSLGSVSRTPTFQSQLQKCQSSVYGGNDAGTSGSASA
jgi:hypothetical protein